MLRQRRGPSVPTGRWLFRHQRAHASAADPAIPALVRFMAAHMRAPTQAVRACRVLLGLAMNADNRAAVGEAGGIPVLVAALKHHSADASVVQIPKVAIVAAGAIAPVMAALVSHASDPDVVAAACCVLCTLGMIPETGTAVAAAGALHALVKAKALHPGNLQVVAAVEQAVSNMTTSAEGCSGAIVIEIGDTSIAVITKV